MEKDLLSVSFIIRNDILRGNVRRKRRSSITKKVTLTYLIIEKL